MANPKTKGADIKSLVVEAVRSEGRGVSVAELVQSLSVRKRLSADETYEGVRMATQQGELRFNSEMKLVAAKA
jgi:hypothetical protein